MSNQHNTIIWQKWFDPFGFDSDIEQDNIDYDNYQDDNDDELINHTKNILDKEHDNSNKKIKMIATPMGLIPIDDHTSASKIFNFWLGHTNFDITPYIAAIIEQTDGVETLDVFTRYRFRIGVGKAFDDSVVMRDINKRVYMEL